MPANAGVTTCWFHVLNGAMPYLLLVAGLLIGAYALYRFFATATVPQIKAFIAGSGVAIIALILIILAVTKKLPAAIALLVVTFPFIWKFIRARLKTDKDQKSAASGPMTRDEALKILGLSEGASEDDITEAYKRLMQKVHPDNQGTDWMAAKLNAARDLLLK